MYILRVVSKKIYDVLNLHLFLKNRNKISSIHVDTKKSN